MAKGDSLSLNTNKGKVREALRSPIDVLNSLQSKSRNEDYKYERLYRNLYNPEFYLLAYQNIYDSEGNMTEGTDGKTIDGMGTERINSLIEKMKNYSYQPCPARRKYIEKKGNSKKKRPLGIPSVDDKIVQEIVKMILESIFEPTFQETSHGFRPNRSCHTALLQIKKEFTAAKWFIEGDIRGFFDNIDHQIMVEMLRKRIKDEHFLGLIWKFLKAGYLEDWVYHSTYSGTPQGSIISPILSNIYLNEFDKFMEKYKKSFSKGNGRTRNMEYRHWEYKLKYIRHKKYPKSKWETMTPEERKPIIKRARKLKQKMHSIPYSDQMDKGYKRLVYVRYADDWLCGVIGSKEDAETIKADIKKYLLDELKLELSDEKTLITHSSDSKANFLGYEIFTTKDESLKKHENKGYTRRTRMGRIRLFVPKEKWFNKLMEYGALEIKYDPGKYNQEVYKPVHRNYLVNNDDLDILMQYNSEIRGMYNYYRIADNASVLNNFFYVMKFSLFKTLARKYQKRISQIRKMYGRDKEFGVEYETKKGKQKMYLYNEGFKKDPTPIFRQSIDNVPSIRRRYSRNGLISRLKANQCEKCGCTDQPMEVHHVKKLKNLKGKKNWERHMIAMRRKTMVLCKTCHEKLHKGLLD